MERPDDTVRAALDALVAELDYPMLVVTAADGGERVGCLVGFATQCSIEPMRFLVCLSKRNRTFRVASRTGVMAVHVVPERSLHIAELFGAETGDRVDKFADCAWKPGPRGVPLLEECPDWFAGSALARLDAGDHVAFLLEPFAAGKGPPQRPLAFRSVRHLEPGHEA